MTKIAKPHEQAPHVGAMFRLLPHSDMRPVEIAMRKAIETLTVINSTNLDLTNPDNGIPYALGVCKVHHEEKIIAACDLLRMCLHALERRETTENERIFIPLLLGSLSGYVPDNNRRIAKRPRTKKDALSLGIKEALEKFRSDCNWKRVAVWLSDEGIVEEWDEEKVKFTIDDGKTLKTISSGSFRNRVSKAKKSSFDKIKSHT